MHGNTESAAGGRKTRRFEAILAELEAAIEIHRAAGGVLGGVHIELTGEDVTECTGGARGLDDAGLDRAYRSFVDPRLNYEQALEMALLVARKLARPAGAQPREGQPEATAKAASSRS
jgi:3-deoxy-7-phosphoheptulonate synthase